MKLENQERKYGIDILKIVVMLMIVMWHLLGHGGLLSATTQSTTNYYAVWTIESILYCVVDIYVMITGYLYVKNKWYISSIVKLWIVVAFYSVTVPLVLKVLGFNIETKTIIKGFFPILQNQYWYFTEYVALFFTIPLLNIILTEKKYALYTISVGTILLSVIPVVAQGRDLFFTNHGYSFLWFMLLYCWGGYLRLYGLPLPMKKGCLAVVYILSTILLILSKIGLEKIENRIWGEIRYAGLLHSYTSPLVLIGAIIIVVLFAEMRVTRDVLKKTCITISSLTFGVYLIHENGAFRELIIYGSVFGLASKNTYHMIAAYMGFAFALFCGCLVIEYIRKMLFVLLHIDSIIDRISIVIDDKIHIPK